jgi:patatin-like phospholipase
MTVPPPLSSDDLAQYFPARRDQAIKPGAFEIGLCLGGTVSAGAYTGGVLDYLVEALDAWTADKDRGVPEAPVHDVVISTVAGTSGGAINGGILLRAAGWEYDHGPNDDNPFFSSWTSGVDLMKLLSPAPEADSTGLVSIFNCAAIAAQAAKTIAYHGRPLGSGNSPSQRSYFADPLRLFMMVGNVTGLPYSIAMSGQSGLSHDLVAHADFVRFALTISGGVPNPPVSRPDEFALVSTSSLNWDELQKSSLATSAFPLAFRSRPLARAMEVCGYRAIAVPPENDQSPAKVLQLIPRWDVLSAGESNPEICNFVNVDGGTTNNEPLDVVRTSLAGLAGRNPREPGEANRAVVLIDPFSDPEALGPHEPPSLVGLALPFIMSLVYQARYKPTDIALAQDEGTYSRFLIAPVGPAAADGKRAIGSRAIASGGLGGFLGFVDRSFLEYDYALGRRNAYDFLKRHLALPEKAKNAIFSSWTDDQRRAYRISENGIDYLPLIPLMPRLRDNPPALMPWPALSEFPNTLSDAIAARLDAVYALAKAAGQPDSWIKRAIMSSYLWLGWKFYLRGALRDGAVNALRSALQQQGLLR